VIKKEAEKVLNYEDLTTEIPYVECNSVIGTSNGNGSWKDLKMIKKYLRNISGKYTYFGAY
jgi:hypothetical protein